MTVEVIKREQVKVSFLKVSAGIRNLEDNKVNGEEVSPNNPLPCMSNGRWEPLISLDSGLIVNWIKGKSAEIHSKVCDDGDYALLDELLNPVKEYKNIYVPETLSIDDDGFGDYIILKVSESGYIEIWDPSHLVHDLFERNEE